MQPPSSLPLTIWWLVWLRSSPASLYRKKAKIFTLKMFFSEWQASLYLPAAVRLSADLSLLAHTKMTLMCLLYDICCTCLSMTKVVIGFNKIVLPNSLSYLDIFTNCCLNELQLKQFKCYIKGLQYQNIKGLESIGLGEQFQRSHIQITCSILSKYQTAFKLTSWRVWERTN